jgi:hypothetical protein
VLDGHEQTQSEQDERGEESQGGLDGQAEGFEGDPGGDQG